MFINPNEHGERNVRIFFADKIMEQLISGQFLDSLKDIMINENERIRIRDMLKNILRYAVLCAIMIIISHMLALSQQTTWEVPMRVLDSMLSLSSLLQFAMAVEIALFLIDFEAFSQSSLLLKIVYLVPTLFAFGFIAVFAGGEEVKLFRYHAGILSSADIWGSIVAVQWSVLLVTIRRTERQKS